MRRIYLLFAIMLMAIMVCAANEAPPVPACPGEDDKVLVTTGTPNGDIVTVERTSPEIPLADSKGASASIVDAAFTLVTFPQMIGPPSQATSGNYTIEGGITNGLPGTWYMNVPAGADAAPAQ